MTSEILSLALRDTFFATVVMLCIAAIVVLPLEEAPLRKFAPAPALTPTPDRV
jgi:hypothetical protein